MPIPTYTPGYPPDGSSLGQTKATIRNNLDGTFETLAIDHVNNNGQPGSNPAGYHTVIHEVTQTNVSTVTGVNQIFSGVPGTLIVNGVTTPALPANGDTQLYSLTGAGTLAQLTGYNAASTGYAWIGGMLMQFGIVTVTGNGSIAYPITLGAAAFSIQLTQFNTTPGVIQFLQVSSSSSTGFSIKVLDANGSVSGSPRTIYWLAIGK